MASTHVMHPQSPLVCRQLQEVRDATDDWSGVTDPGERRRRQNRLHQRAWRRRKLAKVASDEDLPAQGGTLSAVRPWSGEDLHASQKARLCGLKLHGALQRPLVIEPVIPYLGPETTNPGHMTFVFPLSPDHHLITLIQYNVLRGTLTNMAILCILDTMPNECRASLSIPLDLPAETLPNPGPPRTGLIQSSTPSANIRLPSSLHPTLLQQTTPHEAWIDAVPDARMRDNLILLAGTFDGDELCSDLVGGLYDGFDDVERRGILAWGEPWRPEGWEVSEGFARKWGFLLQGCAEMLRATNAHRATRGEEPLLFGV